MTRTEFFPSAFGPPSSERRGGFTLIELMVVVAIITMVTFLIIPSLGGYLRVSINSAVRDMGGVIKDSYNSAMATGRVHRIAYNFKEGTYWVESGPANALLDTAESLEKEERRKRLLKPTQKEAPQSAFAMDKSVTRKKLSLPQGVKFEDVVTGQQKDPLVEGVAYTHFFPHGLAEQTLVHLMDGANHKVTLVISPVSGTTDVYDRYVSLQEAFPN